MAQSKKQSVVEVTSNTIIGFVGSWLITIAVMYQVNNRVTASTLTVVLCTVWSLIRGYYVRRHFNNYPVAETPIAAI